MSSWIFSRLTDLHPDTLHTRYGEEMQWVFREELKRAMRSGTGAYIAFWCSTLYDTGSQVGSLLILRLGIVSTAGLATLAFMLPVLSAMPTHFPKSEGPCSPRVDAQQRVRFKNSPIAFEGVGHEAAVQNATDVPTRNTDSKQPSRAGHYRQLARGTRGISG